MVIYLKIRDDFAECVSHKPRLGDVPQDSRWQAEENDEKVGNSQIDDEHVGDCAHRVVSVNGKTDEEIADQTDNEN